MTMISRYFAAAALAAGVTILAGCASADKPAAQPGAWDSQIGVTTPGEPPANVAVRYRSDTKTREYAKPDATVMRYDRDRREWYAAPSPAPASSEFKPIDTKRDQEIHDAAGKGHPEDEIWK